MNASTLKILVPVALLVVVVFAVTFFSQYVPTDPEQAQDSSTAQAAEPPLRFSAANHMRKWDPFSANLMDQDFQGFYETGETQHAATFWFENPTPKPVTVQLLGVSCSACSGGRVAAIPPEVTKQILQAAAVSALPQGLFSPLPVGMVGAAANLDRDRGKLTWQSHGFNQDPAGVSYTVPAAAGTDRWAPQWGILELNFKVRPNPKIPLRASFMTQAQGGPEAGKEEFEIWFEPATAFEVDRPTIDAGDLTDATAARSYEVIVYSSTRPADQLAGLTVQVMMPAGASGEPGGFVTTGPLVPVVGPDLGRFMIDLSNKLGRPTRVRSAVRLPVTVKGVDGAAKLDIGELGRVIWLTQGTEQRSVTVKGVVRGPVSLSEGKDINLGTFGTAHGANEQVTITTARPGIELEVDRAQTRPAYMEVTLKKLKGDEDRGYYQLKVTIPGEKQQGAIRDGVVVLTIKGPSAQRFRIPVRGQATR